MSSKYFLLTVGIECYFAIYFSCIYLEGDKINFFKGEGSK